MTRRPVDIDKLRVPLRRMNRGNLLIAAVRRMSVGERRAFIEDLLAATSPEYLAGIREARADRRAGRVKSLREVFRA